MPLRTVSEEVLLPPGTVSEEVLLPPGTVRKEQEMPLITVRKEQEMPLRTVKEEQGRGTPGGAGPWYTVERVMYPAQYPPGYTLPAHRVLHSPIPGTVLPLSLTMWLKESGI